MEYYIITAFIFPFKIMGAFVENIYYILVIECV